MLTHTFCHTPGLGVKTEERLWNAGIHTWDQALSTNGGPELPLKGHKAKILREYLDESRQRLDDGDAAWFGERLPPSESWRLFDQYRDQAAYVDIETTGGDRGLHYITTIALWDGREARSYVHGRNLDDFIDDVWNYKLLVTFNGRCFDAPMIEQHYKAKLPMAHLDLRFALKGAGIAGGLKKVEKHFGLTRGLLDGVDGYWAVLLWREYDRKRNENALRTLLAYNMEDVLSLEVLATHAYNHLVAATPFGERLQLDVPMPGLNPQTPDPVILEKLQRQMIRRFPAKYAAMEHHANGDASADPSVETEPEASAGMNAGGHADR